MTQTTTITFLRFDRWQDRAWALGMMGFARFALPKVPDLGFWKLCGSGTGEGFTPVPNTSVYAILCTWPDKDTARHRLADQNIFQRYFVRASEHWTLFLETVSARGEWSGHQPFSAEAHHTNGPIAALTRATVKLGHAHRFWRRVPKISTMIGADPNVIFKIGIGEVPMLHQITFSIWPGTAEMAAFARTNGPHGQAIQAVRNGHWFREELYARFTITGETGTWNGRSPLATSEIPS